MILIPKTSEYIPYFESYISLVDGDVIESLLFQVKILKDWFLAYPNEKLDLSYAPNKWTTKEVLQHIIDTERIMFYRAFSISRNETNNLPGFDENKYIKNADTINKPLNQLLEEYSLQRASTIALFKGFNKKELSKVGIANNAEISVRAIIYLVAGHELHHFSVLKERY